MKSSFAVITLALFLASPLVSAQVSSTDVTSSAPGTSTPGMPKETPPSLPGSAIPTTLTNNTKHSVVPSSIPHSSEAPGSTDLSDTTESTGTDSSSPPESTGDYSDNSTGTKGNTTASRTGSAANPSGSSDAPRGIQIPMVIVATVVGMSVAVALGL